MTLQQLKDEIILKIGDMYSEHFIVDINECDNGYEILYTLEQYGYDTQGSLDIMFSILIK